MTKRPDQYRTIGDLTGAERRAVTEARTAALALVALLGTKDLTCHALQEAHATVDTLCEKVEGLLFDPSWAATPGPQQEGASSPSSN